MSRQSHPDVFLGLHLYSDDHDRIVGTVSPALDMVNSAEESAWIVRYRDTIGAHVRLRLRVRPHHVRPALDTLKQIRTDAVRPDGCAQSATFMPYQPELWKYRSLDEVEAASHVWMASTRLAVAGAEATDVPSRMALLLATLQATVNLLNANEAEQFLAHYTNYWSAGSAHAGSALPRATLVPGDVPAGCDALIAEYVVELDRYLNRSVDNRRSRGFLLFHQVHLTNNRLGTSPELEVAVADMIGRA